MAASTVTKPETPGHWHDPAAVAVYGTELRGAKQGDGKERRVEIAYNDPIPYRWICKIKIFNEVANETVELPESCPCKDCKAEENQLSKCKYTPKSTSAPAYGTGFLVNIPQSTRCILFTAAHNLAFKAKDSAFMDPKDDNQDKDSEHQTHIVSVARIVVTFPGKEPIIIKKKHFFFPSRYTCRHIDDFARSNYDYGVVVLPGTRHPNQACGFGFTATMTDRELLGGISLSIFGYPMLKDEEMKQSNVVLQPGKPSAPATSGASDSKPNLNTRDDRELYGSGGNVQSVGPRMIRYFVNTSEGQSGCPVYLWDAGYYTVVGIHVRFERLGEYTINAASRIRVGMLQNILTWLHTYDVDVYRPKHTNDPTVPVEVATRTAEDFWYPFWHVGLSSETCNRILNISGPAPRDPSMVQTITFDALDPASEQQDQPFEELVAAFGQKNPGAQIGILPVKTFSEGQRVDFQDNLWVLSSIEYPDTFVTFDSFHDVYEKRISASSRYRNTPILSKALELVKMFMLPQVEGDPTRDWQIIPLRCPNVIYQPDRMKSSAERRRFDAHFQGFDFQHVTITKMGDEAGAVVVAVPTARVKLAGMDELEEDEQDKAEDEGEGGKE